jgi:protoporphyrinogen oxidase
VWGRKANPEHLDGAFYYPSRGIGSIADRLAEGCGGRNIQLRTRVTKLLHTAGRIFAVETDGERVNAVDEVVTTLPLPVLLRLLDPGPPEAVLAAARGLSFRGLILVALFLARRSVTRSGTVYFPDLSFRFTRVYEPRNRSVQMAPPGHTSLVTEMPCNEGEAIWHADPAELIDSVRASLIRIGWFAEEEVVDATVRRMPSAYPVLKVDSEERVQRIVRYLSTFHNLHLCGRNATFSHASIHDIVTQARKLVAERLPTGAQ